MKKLRIIFTILLLLPLTVNALELKGIYSTNVLVYDLDEDTILYEKNYTKKIQIASLTKIMTTLVAIENIQDLNKEITITYSMLKNVPSEASIAGLKVGDKMTYKDLLYAAMIPSGADATDSLAVSLFGSTSKFIEAMNNKAKELNMTNTHFVNTTGLTIDNHYSTLEDLLKLIKYALKNDTFKEVFETKNYTTKNGLKLQSTLNKYNKNLNYNLDYILGSKTGYTDEAGLCLLTLSLIEDEHIITITTNAPVDSNKNKNIVDINNIQNAIKKQYDKEVIINKDTIIYNVPTKYAKEDINITVNKDITKFVEVDKKQSYTIDYQGMKEVPYNTKIGTKIGTLTIYYGDYIVYQEDVILNNKLHFSFKKWVKNYKLLIISILLLIVMFIYRKNIKIFYKNIKKRLA